MKKFTALLAFLFFIGSQVVNAQDREISGIVTSAEDGNPIPGANVVVKGTTNGTITDLDGKYNIKVEAGEKTLVFSFVGMQSKEVVTSKSTTLDVALNPASEMLKDVVVTALGISREKKSLGYSTQEVKGEDVAKVRSDNFVNSLSGKVSGIQIKTNNNFGGSTNIVVRGVTSLSGNNQALFVVDGVPIDNSTTNTTEQQGGDVGYDYGNAAADINPDDIASINVLKGAAATALYGSRAANGVILITTKAGKSRKGIGVTYSGSVTVGQIDKSTFIEYQDKYGAGYGSYYGSTGYFEDIDVDGDGTKDRVVPTYEDGSFGPKFDGSSVYQWDSFVPEAKNFGKAYEYAIGEKTPVDFFETEVTFVNAVSLNGGNDKSTFRLGYTNYNTNGILPNSELKKHNVTFRSNYKLTNKLEAGANVNYVYQSALGRNSTGYNDNLMSQFRQWWQVNTNIAEQERLYKETGRNVTWNPKAPWNGDFRPQYWDNPYWTRYQNYQTDSRSRIIGSLFLTYKITDWLKATGKVNIDTYTTIQEERRSVGSVPTPFGLLRSDESSGYMRYNRNFVEMNYDAYLNFNKSIGTDLNLTGITGVNIRRSETGTIRASTNGGLVVPKLYSLANSAQSVPVPTETLLQKQVNGYYINASLGYKNFLYVEPTFRYDVSSALPDGNNGYSYYSVSGSMIFSELLKTPWLDLGKVRLNYAEVGNDLAPLNVYDVYAKPDIFGSSTLYSISNRKNNQELVPERTKSIEAGLEINVLKNRLGLDFAWYKMNTFNQLMASEVSSASGYSSKWVNAGNIQNSGLELSLFGKPIQNKEIVWEVRLNWSANKSLVKELYVNEATGEPLQNAVIQSFQGGITVNATVDQPYGVLRGTGFKYHENGGKLIDSKGYYVAEADQIIADPNPDWIGGLHNSISYKGVTLGFLIDMQMGGDVYSLDMHYGQGTGLPANTVGTNANGKPFRSPVSDGGGVLNEGVKEDGTPNDVYASAEAYDGAFYWGNADRNPGQLTVYDASYVKLREVSLSYKLPKGIFGNYIQNASVSLTGRNLWIIHKNVPYADPESGLGAGNAQGYLSGSYPTVRQFGFNVKLDF